MSASKPGNEELNSLAKRRYLTIILLNLSPGMRSGIPGG